MSVTRTGFRAPERAMTGEQTARRWTRKRAARWMASPFAFGAILATALYAQPALAPHGLVDSNTDADLSHAADISVMTYNVKALPWPLARGRPAALHRIAGRLAQMRRLGIQPEVVVLQEAFTPAAVQMGHLAGYAHVIEGPAMRSAPTGKAADDRDWLLGETSTAAINGGLVVFSDFPVHRIERIAFRPENCAGYDCLAAKGVLLVELAVPGAGRVAVADTHLNSQGASGAPRERTTAAFGRQVSELARFVSEHARGLPVVLAGDFNQGQRQDRIALLDAALSPLAGRYPLDCLRQSMSRDANGLGKRDDVAWIRNKARDLQYGFDGQTMRIVPIGADVPFGIEADGSMLSDHMGYTIHYRLEPA